MHPVATWRGSAIRALFVGVFGLAGLASCTMVSDSLTGVSLSKKERGTCISQCSKDAKLSIEEEQKLHQENVRACQLLSEAEQEACFDAEGARHSAAMQSISDARRECHNNCHSQGRGSAG